MALFTSAIVASFFAVEATFITAAAAFALNLAVGVAVSYGLSYAAKALAGNPNKDEPASQAAGVQLQLQAGADLPRSFQLGYSVTGGSLVYANTWGSTYLGDVFAPNAFLVQVIALADLPCGDLLEVWVNGELVTLDTGRAETRGTPVTEYVKDGEDHLWIKYYDGTQTTADFYMYDLVRSADRPYESTRVGNGVAYVIATALVNETLFSGIPTFKFAVSGMPLYDPTKDSTNGGSGAHRYSDPTTWGGDGDDLPAVQIYNILRGISYGANWFYGLQLLTAARLPSVNWNAQIDKCRATITGTSGLEATYRTGGQVSIGVPPIQIIETILTGCQGRLSEIGGFYKIHLGAPDSAVGSFTDDDILSTEEQNFSPFFGLADSINGITASYPSPAEGWNMKPAPPLYDTTFEAEDGARRLLANPTFDFVPYDAQAQRLQKSALQEARRARRHTLGMPPPFWIYEPGDVLDWTSLRNGYVTKQFRLDGIVDKANLDNIFNITEVDPSDYDWTHATDFQGITIGPTVFQRPEPQSVVDWFVEPYTLIDDSLQPRRPAIKISWDNSAAAAKGVVGVQYECRLAADGSVVTRGRTDQFEVGSLIFSQSLVPDTDYEVRGQYLPSSPRDMLWSDWLPVTTPAVSTSLADFDAALIYQTTQVMDYLNDQFSAAEQLIASVASKSQAGAWLARQEIREELKVSTELASASIAEIRSVQIDDQVAFANYQLTVAAAFGATNASVTTNASAVATLNGYAAAQYSVTLDVNGYAIGFNLLNGGAGISEATFVVDKFQIAAPGETGGDATPIFTVANVNGSPKIAIRADDFLVDGTILARAIAAGTVTANEIAADTITSNEIASQTITSASGVIGDLSVDALSIGDAAITVPAVQTLSSAENAGGVRTVNSVTLSIDTTGLAGKEIWIVASWCGTVGYTGTGGAPTATIVIDGSNVQTVTVTNSQDGFMVLTGAKSFTASGGVDVKGVLIGYSAGATGGPQLLQRTLWATAAKR